MKKITFKFCVAFFALLHQILAGCTITQSEERSAGDLRKEQEAPRASSLHCVDRGDCGLPKGALSVRQLVFVAAARSHEVRRARAGLIGARANVDGAKAAFYPSFQVTSQWGQSGDLEVVSGVRQPIWSAGRLKYAQSASRAEEEAALAQVKTAQQTVSFEIIDAYGRWFKTYQSLISAQDNLRRHQETLAQLERLRGAGRVVESEVISLRSRVVTLKAEIATLQSDQAQSVRQMGKIATKPVTQAALEAGANGNAAAYEQNQQALITAAMQIHPQTQKADATANARKAQLERATAERYPSLAARAQGVFKPNTGDFETRAFLGFEYEFGAGNSQAAKEAAIKAQVSEAQLDQSLTREELGAQISDLFMGVGDAQSRIAVLSDLVQSSRDILASYERQKKATTNVDWRDMIGTYADLHGNRVSLADAKASLLVASYKLAILSQGIPF